MEWYYAVSEANHVVQYGKINPIVVCDRLPIPEHAVQDEKSLFILWPNEKTWQGGNIYEGREQIVVCNLKKQGWENK